MKRVTRIHAAVLLAAASFIGCQPSFAECGIASTYSSGSRTANGENYDHMGVSAAHKTLPFGTRVVVRNQQTGRAITVRINDRGPFVEGRIIDLSTGAKNALGMDGLAPVCLEVVSYGSEKKGFKGSDLREPLQAANSTQPARKVANSTQPARKVANATQPPHKAAPSRHYAHSTAKVHYAHQGRSRSANAPHRGERHGHQGSRGRLYASN